MKQQNNRHSRWSASRKDIASVWHAKCNKTTSSGICLNIFFRSRWTKLGLYGDTLILRWKEKKHLMQLQANWDSTHLTNLSEIGVTGVKHCRPEPGIKRHLKKHIQALVTYVVSSHCCRKTIVKVYLCKLDSPGRRRWWCDTWGSGVALCFDSAATWEGKPGHSAERPGQTPAPQNTGSAQMATVRKKIYCISHNFTTIEPKQNI